ncbi:MAG: type II toxin-antitoxin system VapC family toxin [Terriglobia bacterium]
MTTYLLDTSVIIDALNGKRGRDALLKQLLHEGHLLGCSSIQVSEVYAGLSPQEEAVSEELLRSLEYYEVTWEIARLAGILKRDYARNGITLAIADVTIAAVALTHQLTLITGNPKHYPMKDLQRYPLV